MTKIILFLFLGFICFFYALNLFLRGKWKQIIEGVLGIIIVATVIASFFILDWRWGLVALVSSFVFVGLSRSPAQALAHRILGYRTGVVDQLESTNALAALMSSGDDGFKKYFEKIDREEEKKRQRLFTLAHKTTISAILQKHNVSLNEYEELYSILMISNLNDLAWEILSTPNDLDLLIQMKKQGKSEVEIFSYFRDFK